MTPRATHAATGCLAVAALIACLSVVVPGTHLPTGDGAHLLAASWRIWTSSAPLDDLLHRVTPHPPLAYIPSALFVPHLGVRATLGCNAVLAAAIGFLGLRWLRPDAHPSDRHVALAFLLASGLVFWAVDQSAPDWPATTLSMLALGAVTRAIAPGAPPKRAGVLAGLCLLAAIFTKYTSAFALAGGVAVALGVGAWRNRTTWIAAAIVLFACGGWGLWALNDLTAYGATTMEASGAGGPAGAINQDPGVSLAERLSPARLRLWALALRDTLGWAPLAGVLTLLALHRAPGTGARIALGGAFLPLFLLPLLRIQPQPRYLLLTSALLVAASLPLRTAPRRWMSTVALAGLTILSLVYSTALYQAAPIADRPGHRSAVPTDGLGDWPWPPKTSWPTRSRVQTWGTLEALEALEAQLSTGETAALVRFGQDPDRPSWAAIDLQARSAGITREWVVAESPRGPLSTPPGMAAPSWAWVSWTDASAAPALAWVQTHADIEGAVTWRSSDGTGGVVLPLGAHHH